MNHRVACLAIVAVVLLGIAVPVRAQEPGGRGAREGGPRPPMAMDGERVRIRSAVAGATGIAALVTWPRTPRYAAGAPVVIHVHGGWDANGLTNRAAPMSEFGFVEIRFAFPGGGAPDFRSGGTADNRGADSIHSLRDVLLFALGRNSDVDGKSLQDHAGALPLLAGNVGLAGWSNGGNVCGLAMARHGADFPELAYYASFESPYGEGAGGAELGGFGTNSNPEYNADTGVLRFDTLAFDPEMAMPAKGGGRKPGGRPGAPAEASPALRGALYFDRDGNGRYDAGSDYATPPVTLPDLAAAAPGAVKAWYSLRMLRAAETKGLFRAGRPSHMPTLAEAEAFWALHDATPAIGAAVKNCPKAGVIVYASQQDHVQIALDHPHILAQVEAFRDAGAAFIRLNPDRAYVAAAVGRDAGAASDNPAGRGFDHQSIRTALEPEDITTDAGFMAAAITELADRAQTANWQPNLAAVLAPDAPRGSLLPPRPSRK